jgi:hypothetical protein
MSVIAYDPELSGTKFAIPSYTGGSLGRVAIYRYVYGNMGVIYFCKGVIDERVVRVTADGASIRKASDGGKVMKALHELSGVPVRPRPDLVAVS